MSKITDRNGQTLLLVVVMMGGVIFLVTSVAGLLMFYQVEHASDAANSTVAIFAADAGLERALYYYFFEYDPTYCDPNVGCIIQTGDASYIPVLTAVTFGNGAGATSTIVVPPQAQTGEPVTISGTGRDAGARTVRALETNFFVGL